MIMHQSVVAKDHMLCINTSTLTLMNCSFTLAVMLLLSLVMLVVLVLHMFCFVIYSHYLQLMHQILSVVEIK
jgi:hypothetical protein